MRVDQTVSVQVGVQRISEQPTTCLFAILSGKLDEHQLGLSVDPQELRLYVKYGEATFRLELQELVAAIIHEHMLTEGSNV